MKAQIEKFVLFVCLKKLLFVFMYFYGYKQAL